MYTHTYKDPSYDTTSQNFKSNKEKQKKIMYKLFSLGYRCTSSSLIKNLKLKEESYPFDWLVSRLNVVQDCIDTKFIHFLNEKLYTRKKMDICNTINGQKIFYSSQEAEINMYYENDVTNTDLFNSKLAMNHQNIFTHKDYYIRCIQRLYSLLDNDIQKFYLYTHPLMGSDDFSHSKERILKEFALFSNYIITKTKNIYGIYIILCLEDKSEKSVCIHNSNLYTVFVIYCNNNFIDRSFLFAGDYEVEEAEASNIILNVIQNKMNESHI